jgi:hypothetical protein
MADRANVGTFILRPFRLVFRPIVLYLSHPWSWSCVSAIDSNGQTTFVVDRIAVTENATLRGQMRSLLRLSSLNQRLSATPTHAANQSTPLMPAQPKNAKQPACNRRGNPATWGEEYPSYPGYCPRSCSYRAQEGCRPGR